MWTPVCTRATDERTDQKGTRQRVPFTLRGQHARIALAQITLQSRLVPLSGGGVQTTVRPR